MNNYLKLQQETLEKVFEQAKKPRLCMHVCCGPCSTFPLSFLTDYFDLTLYFNNSNIYPSDEYYRRLDELKAYLSKANLNVKLIVNEYDNIGYNKILSPYANEMEGGQRCKLCYQKRMDEAYNYAHINGYDYFCTVMTISRQKNSKILNDIGSELEIKYPNTKYFYSDFKKQNGNLIGQEIAKQYDLYRQDYCGCIYSYNKKHSLD